MAFVRDAFSIPVSVSNQPETQLSENLPFRPLTLSRAPTPTLLVSGNQCGSALATEIDSYRRRIQTLVHFFDCIAQHWWDHLYPYKRDLIKRPSRSADEIRSYRTRLVARLSKFTTRTVVPAAAAIAMMEAHASVKVLPPNLLSPLSSDMITTDIPGAMDNSAVLLDKACNLARRIGDIEKLKQRLLLAALTWITSDGRDFNLRSQRIALLARHAEPCLIEHFAGVRALLTHYYRPRVLTHKSVDPRGATEATAKASATARTEPITAAKLTSTNEQIASAIERAFPRARNTPVTQMTDSDEVPNEGIRTPPGTTFHQFSLQHVSRTDDLFNNLSSSIRISQNATSKMGNSQIPMLPSIVLNPLSIDTSQLDWLSYEVNQREFNLHVLNSEEPEDGSPLEYKLPKEIPVFHTGFQPSDSTRNSITSSSQVTKSRSSLTIPVRITSPPELTRPNPNVRVWTSRTPIATPNSKDYSRSGSSRDSEISGPGASIQGSADRKPDEAHRADEIILGLGWTSTRSSEELSGSATTLTPMTAHGEEAATPSVASVNARSDHVGAMESPTSGEKHSMTATNPTSKGEEPSFRTQTEKKQPSIEQSTEKVVNRKKSKTSVHWRSAPKSAEAQVARSSKQKGRGLGEAPSISRTQSPWSTSVTQLVHNHSVDSTHRSRIPARKTPLSNLRERKSSR